MPLLFQHRIYRRDLQANPDLFYVFGDNEGRVGLGGQAAEMRGEPNAIGVATLSLPGVFWTEADNRRQCAVVDQDMALIFEALRAGRIVVWPLDGIGTGLAQLEQRAPTTFAHLQDRVEEMRVCGQLHTPVGQGSRPLIGVRQCCCGYAKCRDYWLTGIGKFVQGSGFTKEEALGIAAALNSQPALCLAAEGGQE